MYYIFIYISRRPIWNLKTENMKLRKVGWISKNHSATQHLGLNQGLPQQLTTRGVSGLVESWAVNFIIYLIWPATPILFQGHLVDHSRDPTAPMGCVGALNENTLPIPEYNIPNSSFLTHGYTWPHPCTNDLFLKHIVCSYIATTFVFPAETSCLWILIPFQLWVEGSWLMFSTLNSNQNKYPRSQNPKVASHSGGWEVSVVSVCFPFKTRKAMYVLSRNVTWSTTPTGTKRKIQVYEKEKWRQKERRAKLNLAFHLPFSPRMLPIHTPTQCQMFQMFSLFLPSAQLQIPARKGKGGGESMPDRCVYPLLPG